MKHDAKWRLIKTFSVFIFSAPNIIDKQKQLSIKTKSNQLGEEEMKKNTETTT